METKKMAAIGIVAVIVVAAVGIGWIFLSDDSSSGITIEAALPVYGNANGDDRVDSEDVQIINEIIIGNKTFEDYPLADANYDGIVNNDDILYVRSIIDATPDNTVRLYHMNYFDGGTYVADTMYPITSAVATGASNSLLVFMYLGIYDEIKGLSFGSTKPDTVLFSGFSEQLNGTNLGIVPGSTTSATRMNYDKVINLKADEGVTAIVTSDNRTYVTNESDFENVGIDIIRLKPSSADEGEFASTMLLLGFLFDTDGKGYLDKCGDLIDWYEGFLNDVNDKLKNVSKRVSAIASSSNASVGTSSSEFTKALITAGATFPLTDVDSASATASYNKGDAWLSRYHIDYVFNIRTSPSGSSWYGGTVLTDASSNIVSMIDLFSLLECYQEDKNVYVMSGDMPVMLRVAYAAETMYPEIFGNGYADSKHQDFAKRFMGLDQSFMEGKRFIISMADAGLA